MSCLQHKASDIEDFIEKYFIAPKGVVYSNLDKDTKYPAEDDLFIDAKPCTIPGVSWCDVYIHENCGMCTGAYMQAMTLKYRCTGDKQALEKAKRCLGALKYIYELGKQREKGFFPKIYGGHFFDQTSTDQVLYAVSAMDNFYDLGDDEDKKDIEKMIPSMIEFWVKNDYHEKYYHVEDMLWPLDRFASLLLLASRYSDNEIFKSEYKRLLPLTDYTDCSRLRLKLEGKKALSDMEKKSNSYFIYHSADALTMATMQYDILLQYDHQNNMREKWLIALKQMWDESRLTLNAGGYYYSQAYVDMDTKTITRTPGYSVDGSSIHCAESAWSTMIVRAAAQLLDYLPNERDDITEKLLTVLTKLDAEDMLYYRDKDAARFVPQERFKTRLLSGDAITNWLWAYWKGYFIKLW